MSLEERLRRLRAPSEDEAGDRSWPVVRAAFEQQSRPRVTSAHRLRRPLMVAAAGAASVALLVTPAGAKVADWIEDVVERDPRPAVPAPLELPAVGRLLVDTGAGPWIINRDGSKRLLGDYEAASWSPQGLFVVAHRGPELSALEPNGRMRWQIRTTGPVMAARWAPSGFRIAYLAASQLRVVAGDGTGDRPLARKVRVDAIAWRPGDEHVLAYGDRNGGITVADVDSGATMWALKLKSGEPPVQLAWSADGERLLALSRSTLSIFSGSGHLLRVVRIPPTPPETPNGSAALIAFDNDSHIFALVRRQARTQGREVVLLDAERDTGPPRRLFAAPGPVDDLAWSPDGNWLLINWRANDQWLFVAVDDARRIRSADRMSERFDAGAPAGPQAPGRAEWCC